MQYKNISNAEITDQVTCSNKLNIAEQVGTPPNAKSARKVQGGMGKFSKTDARYWMQGSRLFKHKGSTTYSFQVQYKKDRHSFPTSSSEKTAAAKIAAKINLEIVQNGMEVVLAKYRPQKVKADTVATIGEWIKAAQEVASANPRTFNCYADSLRLIAGQICEIKKESDRFGPRSGGAAQYRSKVDGLSLEVLTPASVQKWRLAYVASVKKGGTKKSRMTSCNSTIRQAKSLFASKIVTLLPHLLLPTPIPFDGVQRFPKQATQYNSVIDPDAVIKEAQRELGATKPSVFLAILLGLGAGLRRHEIDCQLWKYIFPDKHEMLVNGSKTPESHGMVPIDENVSALLARYKEVATGKFVLESNSEEYGPRSWGYKYRANGVLDEATAWLRDHGVEAQKPLQELRKEYGSHANAQHGLVAASRNLRHSSPTITAAHYVDLKTRPVVKMGGSLDLSAPIAVPTMEAAKAGKTKKG